MAGLMNFIVEKTSPLKTVKANQCVKAFTEYMKQQCFKDDEIDGLIGIGESFIRTGEEIIFVNNPEANRQFFVPLISVTLLSEFAKEHFFTLPWLVDDMIKEFDSNPDMFSGGPTYFLSGCLGSMTSISENDAATTYRDYLISLRNSFNESFILKTKNCNTPFSESWKKLNINKNTIGYEDLVYIINSQIPTLLSKYTTPKEHGEVYFSLHIPFGMVFDKVKGMIDEGITIEKFTDYFRQAINELKSQKNGFSEAAESHFYFDGSNLEEITFEEQNKIFTSYIEELNGHLKKLINQMEALRTKDSTFH